MEFSGPYNPHDTKLFICDRCQKGIYTGEGLNVYYCNKCCGRTRKGTDKEKAADAARVQEIKKKYPSLFKSEFFVPFRYYNNKPR